VKAFAYRRVSTVDEGVNAYAGSAESRFIGGGTNLLDLMKMGVETPSSLIDISRLPLRSIEEHDGGVRIGALVSNTDAANHELIRGGYPVLSEAILAGASQQLRNMATMGGNLLQRTRCYYFYDPSFTQCNKRSPGSGCAAKQGANRIHAILGASESCIATHPSDMCVALAALDAVVQVSGPKGQRSIPFHEFHRLPGDTPQIDTNLHPGELITAIDLPAASRSMQSHYLKIRDRSSYAFALVSVAAVLKVDEGGEIRRIGIAMGGVAHKPWRASIAEKALVGRKVEREHLRMAAASELKVAKAYPDNAFKVELARRAIVRAVTAAAEGKVA
jgi:xanthine dehydrogenase YagS FAD-binding subunit